MELLLLHGAAVLIAAIGAVTDTKTGLLPNWLTLPPLVVAPFIAWGVMGMNYGLGSLLGIVVCGLVPYLLFRTGGIAGGDVKMFAAIGALMGPYYGIEAEFYALIAAVFVALGRLAWKGKLFATLTNTFLLAFGWALPEKHKRKPTEEELTTMRLGVPILIGTGISAFLNTPYVARLFL